MTTKKSAKLLFAGVLILGLFCSLVVATNVAYIVNNPAKPDKGFLEAFNESGLSVTLIDDDKIKQTNFDSYDLIFVGDELLKNVKKIPVDSVPSIIANKYYGKEFGLLDLGTISQVSSNDFLRVMTESGMIQVYDQPSFMLGSSGIPYYYIPCKYQEDGMQSIATTMPGYKVEVGNVIIYSNESDLNKKCFFGIVKTEYWTEETEELFSDCVDFVMGGTVTPPEDDGDNETVCVQDWSCTVWTNINNSCGTRTCNDLNSCNNVTGKPTELVECSQGELIHDVGIDTDYSNTLNGIRIQDDVTNQYLVNDSKLTCNKRYIISYKTVNFGDFLEDVSFAGKIANYSWTASKTGLLPGASTTTGSKTINMTFAPGIYNLNITLTDVADDNLANNFASREVEVVCPMSLSIGITTGIII